MPISIHTGQSNEPQIMRKLISRTIAAGESATALTWTKDDEGVNLNLVEVRIKVHVPANSIAVGTTGYALMRINDLSGASDYYYTYVFSDKLVAAYFKTQMGYGDLNLSIINGTAHGRLLGRYYDGSASPVESNISSGIIASISAINKIYVYVSGLTYFPVGTTIEVYGRTA